jgi:cell division control protein 6
LRIVVFEGDQLPQGRSVFKDETKLDINYVPHHLPHREHELRLLREFFGFALQSPGKMAQRVMMTGDVGTGKTALSQRFGADIAHEASTRGIGLRYVHVNCREYRGSLFLILQHLVSVFHPNFPKRGYSAEELLDALMRILDEENAYTILSLDEFESLVQREGSEAIYKLTRLQETRQNKPQRLSLMCILRNLEAVKQLDASTRSTLQSNIISLDKYTKQQLMDILNERVSMAFVPMGVPEGTVELVAELAFSENGNARFGIELLWRAGKYADTEGLDTVAPECAREAVSSILPAMRKGDLATLGLHEKLFLLAIARIFKEYQEASVSLTKVEQTYAVVCEEFDASPISHTQLWKYLKNLSNLGIVETQVSCTGSRGRSTAISLTRIPSHELEKELRSLLEKKPENT